MKYVSFNFFLFFEKFRYLQTEMFVVRLFILNLGFCDWSWCFFL